MIRLTAFERNFSDITILDLKGDITFGEGNLELRKEIRRLLSEGKKKIHLNLELVGYVDSSGIGELISSFTAINRDNGELKLLNPSTRVKELLAISKLLSVFDLSGEHNMFAGYK